MKKLRADALRECILPLSSHWLAKNLKIEICRSIILLVVLCGFCTLSVILRKEHGLSVVENVLLRDGLWLRK